jgi:hypothetical protein
MTRGNMSQAAKLLGVNRTTLYSRIGSEAGDVPGGSIAGDTHSDPQGAAPLQPRRK